MGAILALAGAIVAVVRRKHAVGGWLFYFFWQVLLGLGLVVGTTRWKLYLPRAWFDAGQYFAYVLSGLSRLLLLAAIGLVWLALVRSRAWPWVCGLRYALATYAFLTLLKLPLDALYFPANFRLDALSLAFPCVWMVYFGVSQRVRRVFLEKRWPQS